MMVWAMKLVFGYLIIQPSLVRDHLKHVDQKLNKRGYRFVHLNIFEVLIEMLEKRGLFDRACQREMQVGVDGLRKTLAGPLSQEKIAQYITETYQPSELEFVLLSGLGSAWPLVRGHELLSALQDVMGSTPLVLFYPGEYSGRDLHPFGMIESKNYYRAFKLVPEDGK